MSSVLALDIGGTKLAAAVVSADGSVRGRRVIDTRPEEGADRVIQRALELAATVRQDQGTSAPLTALGVSTKGITREDGVLIAGMPGWSRLRIPALLRERFPDLTVSVMNDVKAATLAEMTWGALRGISHGVYLNLGTGIAAGIVTGGEILEGAHGAAGEIGYILTDREALQPSQPGPTLPEDVPAPLEELIGGRAVPARTKEALGLALTMEQLTERSSQDDKAAALLEDILSELARWTVNLAIVLDPERVVIGGGFLRSPSDLCSRARKAFDQAAVFCPQVEPAHFGADSALVGAGALALRAEASPQRPILPIGRTI
ncbi:MAG: ROK family protein [Acidimicrobiales bacterium]|jgi:glucokinase